MLLHLRLPCTAADAGCADVAQVTNGELEIHVPKTEEASKQQEIKVQ